MKLRMIVIFTVAVIGLATGCDGDHDGSTETSTTGQANKPFCELASTALELVAARLHEGEEAATIIKVLGPSACNYVIETLAEEPYEPVSIEVHLPEGEVTYFDGDADELIAPAPESEPTPGVDIQRIIDCVQSYSIEFLVDECTAGSIEPLAESIG